MDLLDFTTQLQLLFIPLAVTAIIFYVWGHKAVTTDLEKNLEFTKFQITYFLPLFLALFADWLQGPYIYKINSFYGFSQEQNAILYTVGFAAGIPFGTAVGILADKFGRKLIVQVYCLLYSLSCLTKLLGIFWIQVVGRVLAGISMSILYSIFESWYVHEHTISKKYSIDSVSQTFSKQTFFTGLLAILAGLTAHLTSEWIGLGPVSPFLAAIPVLIIAAVLVQFLWKENYGDKEVQWTKSCWDGLKLIFSDKLVLSLGLAQSLFESNVHIFVFMWTPILEEKLQNAPLGLAFASFMTCFMIGSCIYSVLIKYQIKPQVILPYCLATMGVSLVLCGLTVSPELKEKNVVMVSFASFLLLELSYGIYYPCIGRLRGEVVPDHLRANIMNWFRVPMNVIVCGALVGMNAIEHEKGGRTYQMLFSLCSVSAFTAYLVALYFGKVFSKLKGSKTCNETVVDKI